MEAEGLPLYSRRVAADTEGLRRRFSRHALILTFVLTLVIVVLSVLKGLRFVYPEPDLHFALEAIVIVITTFVAVLCLANFYRSGRLGQLLLALGFLSTNVLDVIHSLVYPNFGPWSPASFDPCAYFWIAGRNLFGAFLLASALVPWQISREKRRLATALSFSLAVPGILAGSILLLSFSYGGVLPALVRSAPIQARSVFSELLGFGQLTPLKVGLEFSAFLVYLLVLLLYVRRFGRSPEHRTGWMVLALIPLVVSEIFFIFYPRVYDTSWYAGHILKILSAVYFGVWAVSRVFRAEKDQSLLDKFRGIFAQTPDAVIILGKDGKVEMANEAAGEFFGLGASPGSPPLKRARLEPLFGDDGRPLPEGEICGVRSLADEYVQAQQVRLKGEGGLMKTFLANSAPIRGEEGILGAVMVLRDITEMHRTTEQLLEAYRFQTGFLDGLREVSSSLELGSVLKNLCEQTALLLELDGVCALRVSEDGKSLLAQTSYGQFACIPAGTELRIDHPMQLASEVARSRSPRYRNGWDCPGCREAGLVNDTALESIAAIPLIVGGELLGVVAMRDRKNPRRFNNELIERAQMVVSQMAFAVQNARLYEALCQQAQQEGIVASVAHSLAETTDLETRLEIIAKRLAEIVGASRAFIFALERGVGRVISHYNLSGEEVGRLRQIEFPATSLFGEDGALTELRGVVVESPENCAFLCKMGRRHHWNFGSVLLVPLLFQGKAEGLAMLDIPGVKRDYSSQEINLAALVGSEFGAHLASAWAFQKLKEQAAKERALHSLSEASQKGFSVDETVKLAAETLGGIFGADRVIIWNVLAAEAPRIWHQFLAPGVEGLAEPDEGEASTLRQIADNREVIVLDGREEGWAVEPGLRLVKRYGICAGMFQPIRAVATIHGCIGIQFVRTAHLWQEEGIKFVKQVAAVLALAIESARAREMEKEHGRLLEVMVAEMNHRVKNNLAAVAGLLEAGLAHAESDPDRAGEASLVRDSISRVRSIAVVHDLLHREHLDEVDLTACSRRLLELATSALGTKGLSSEIRAGGPLFVKSKTATSVSLALNELITNALKHGRKDAPSLAMELEERDGKVCIQITNRGRLPEGFDIKRSSGLGLAIVQNLIVGELGGRFCLVTNGEFTTAEVIIPQEPRRSPQAGEFFDDLRERN